MNPLALTLGEAKDELEKFLPEGEEASRLNTVCERILARGKYRGFVGRANFVVQEDGQITLPMDFETLIGATLDDAPQYLRDPWYEFAPKPATGYHIGNALRARDLGEGFVTYRSPATATALRLTSVDGEEVEYTIKGRRSADQGDAGEPFTVTGTLEAVTIVVSGAGSVMSVNASYERTGTTNGRPSYTKVGGGIGAPTISWTGSAWVIYYSLAPYYTSSSDVATPDLATGWVSAGEAGIAPFPTTASTDNTVEIDGEVDELTFFSKTRTTGNVTLEAQQDDGSWLQVAVYQGRDTKISYRRYALPAAKEGDVVVGLCKRRFRKAENDSDPLALDSVYALRMALQAASFEDAGETKTAMEYWGMAVKHLDDQLSEHRGSAMRTIPVFCRGAGGSKLRAIR